MEKKPRIALPISPLLRSDSTSAANREGHLQTGRVLIAGWNGGPPREGAVPTMAVASLGSGGGVLTQPQSVALPQSSWPHLQLNARSDAEFESSDASANCCCDCACECCCDELEPGLPLIFMKPRPWSCATCDDSKESHIGVFVEGIEDDSPEAQATSDRLSGIRYLCQHFSGESWLYRGEVSPFKTSSLAGTIFERLKERICANSYWDRTRSVDKHGDRQWGWCDPITVDLFGFSRGGATVTKVAALLNEAWSCADCPKMAPRGPFTVRYLGVIDPHGEWVAGTGSVPPWVNHFFAAYSTNKNNKASPTILDLPDSDQKNGLKEKPNVESFDTPHGEMDDFDPKEVGKDPIGNPKKYENSPTMRLIANYRAVVSKREFLPEFDKGPCQTDNR